MLIKLVVDERRAQKQHARLRGKNGYAGAAAQPPTPTEERGSKQATPPVITGAIEAGIHAGGSGSFGAEGAASSPALGNAGSIRTAIPTPPADALTAPPSRRSAQDGSFIPPLDLASHVSVTPGERLWEVTCNARLGGCGAWHAIYSVTVTSQPGILQRLCDEHADCRARNLAGEAA